MLTLRLTHAAEGLDEHRVDLRLEGNGAPQAAVSHFKYAVTEQGREDVRWYLEDFLQYPLDLSSYLRRCLACHLLAE